jgi:hypothetical protein
MKTLLFILMFALMLWGCETNDVSEVKHETTKTRLVYAGTITGCETLPTDSIYYFQSITEADFIPTVGLIFMFEDETNSILWFDESNEDDVVFYTTNGEYKLTKID